MTFIPAWLYHWRALPAYAPLWLYHRHLGLYYLLLALPFLALTVWIVKRISTRPSESNWLDRNAKLGLALGGFLSLFLMGSGITNPPRMIELDCTSYSGADMSLQIQACTAALTTINVNSGTANAMGFTGAQTWSVNPLGGTVPFGGILKCCAANITQNAVLVIPPNWHFVGLTKGVDFTHGGSITWGGQATYTTGTVSVTGTAVTGSGTTWTSAMIGCTFAAGTSITTGATSWGSIHAVGSTTSITLGQNGGSNVGAGTAYAIYCPMILMGDGAATSYVGAGNAQAIRVEWNNVNCNNIAGCIPVANYWAQELSTVSHMSLGQYTNIGLDIEASQNSTYEFLNMGAGSSCTVSTIDILIRSLAPIKEVRNATIGPCSGATAIVIDTRGQPVRDIYIQPQAPGTNTIGVAINTAQACPVACLIAAVWSYNNEVDHFWGGATGGTLVKLGNNIGTAVSTSIRNASIIAAATWTNVLQDLGTGCTLPTTSDNHLSWYTSDGAGKVNYSTANYSALPNCTANAFGTPTNNNAPAGYVGEYVTATVASGSSVTLSTGTTATITSISLTAGDWDVWGVVDYTAGATTSITNQRQGISTTAATLGGQDTFTSRSLAAEIPTAAIDSALVTPTVRLSLSATTTVYLVANATFTASSLHGYGSIFARRRR